MICVNWLPTNLALTADVARHAEQAGLWGIGVGDSPRYAELFSACTFALESTNALRVTTCVTNPVTRHWSVHASAARGLLDSYGPRFRLGVGRGDSAVHSFGLPHAGLTDLAEFLAQIREAVAVPLLLASSGPRTAAIAGARADGIIAGVGREPSQIAHIASLANGARPASSRALEVWATIRIAVTDDAEETARVRRRRVPRAISASHFAFGSSFAGKGVPDRFLPVLKERYRRYDYRSHGSSGATSNATMFADRPDIEDYLLDRFAIVGTVEECREQLAQVSTVADGVFLSILFEDAVAQIDRIGEVVRG